MYIFFRLPVTEIHYLEPRLLCMADRGTLSALDMARQDHRRFVCTGG